MLIAGTLTGFMEKRLSGPHFPRNGLNTFQCLGIQDVAVHINKLHHIPDVKLYIYIFFFYG